MEHGRGRFRVLYVTCVDLGPDTNGGALCCRNHVKEFATDPLIDLHVCVTGPTALEASNRKFVETTGAAFSFVDFRQDGPAVDAQALHLHPWEKTALSEPSVPRRLSALAAQVAPDAVVMDYLPTSFFAKPLVKSGVPLIVITLNDEERFFRQLQQHASSPEWACTDLAAQRLGAYELWLYHQAEIVVALRSSDVAHHHLGTKVRVVSPVFPDPGPRWVYGASQSVFFVGNCHHFPNRQAIQWIGGELAPRLEAENPSVEIRIVGATDADFPSFVANNNLRFLGYADRSTVISEMTSCGIFVAPIYVDYGSEIKLQEVISCATPFTATEAALAGLPQIPAVPLLDLENPASCAAMIATYLSAPERLSRLSEAIDVAAAAAREEHRTLWGRLVAAAVEARADRALRLQLTSEIREGYVHRH